MHFVQLVKWIDYFLAVWGALLNLFTHAPLFCSNIAVMQISMLIVWNVFFSVKDEEKSFLLISALWKSYANKQHNLPDFVPYLWVYLPLVKLKLPGLVTQILNIVIMQTMCLSNRVQVGCELQPNLHQNGKFSVFDIGYSVQAAVRCKILCNFIFSWI